MKNLIQNKYVLVGITLIFGASIGWLIKPSTPQQTDDSSAHQHIESSDNQTWTCSMHPQIRSNEPGSCPICGMDLIPVDQDQGEVNALAVSMSPTAMQLANVTTEIVGKIIPIKTLRLNGKVHQDERLVYSQSSHIEGRIEKLMVNFTGQYVTKDEPLAYIYSPDLVTTQEELFETVKIKKSQPALYQAARVKLKNWKLTDKGIDNIINGGKPIEKFPINADISGYVTEKKVSQGEYVMRGQSIYELTNLSKLWILFDIYESDMVWVKKGNLITFSVSSLPGKGYEGRIAYIDPMIDPKTRIIRARLEIVNKDLNLKPGMLVTGTLEARLPIQSEVVVVPKSAVMWTGVRSLVYVKEPTNKGVSFLMKKVTLGPALGNSYIIEEGLEKGEEIAINGTFSIDAAAQLAGKPSMMNKNDDLMNQYADEPMLKEAKETLAHLLLNYFDIKNNLVNGNFKQAVEGINIMKSTLNKIDLHESQHINQSTHQHINHVKEATHQASHFQSIRELRLVFQSMSSAIIGLAKFINPMGEEIYVHHCPMVNNNKGANWLSLSREIRNPYFGDQMLTCGSIKEVLD